MTDPAVLLGSLRQSLAKDYEVEGFVGGGSLGLIYRALEREGRRIVAMRVVPPDASPGLGERVRREARVAINLVHSNIVPVFKVAQAPGVDFYTMRFVDGVTLERILGNQGTLPVPVVLTVLRSLVRALAFAHSRRVIHRDVRGGNVFVDRDGTVGLSDTGIGRALRDLGPAAAGMRSALFASPELCAGQELVPQADQYAVGVLTYLMLTGWPPFTADTPEEVAQQHLTAAPPDLATVRPDTPKQLVEVVRRVLKKTPAERYPTTLEFLAAIQAAPLSDHDRDAAVAQLQQWAQTIPQPPVQTAVAAPPAPPKPAPAPRPAPPAAAPPAPRVAAPPPAPAVSAPPPPPPVEPVPVARAGSAGFPELDQRYLEPETPEAPALAPPSRPAAPPPSYAPTPVVPPPVPPSLTLEPLVPAPEPPRAPRAPEPRPPAPPEPRRVSQPSLPTPRPSAVRFRGIEEVAPRRGLPVAPIAGGVVVLAVAAAAAYFLLGRKPAAPAAPGTPPAASSTSTAAPAPAPTADTTKAAAPAAGAAAAAATVGWVRVRGDFPDDVVFWLDGSEVTGRLFTARPGEHDLQVETAEFEPWDTTITVRAGDTLRLRVELTLKQPSP